MDMNIFYFIFTFDNNGCKTLVIFHSTLTQKATFIFLPIQPEPVLQRTPLCHATQGLNKASIHLERSSPAKVLNRSSLRINKGH